MQSCCIEGCESYKYISKQKIGYFKFPIYNKPLLTKWLKQIRIPRWYPTDSHQICSTHFHVDDIDYTTDYPYKLKKNAVPMIFPLKHFQNTDEDKTNDVIDIKKNDINPNDSVSKQPISQKKKINLIDSKRTSNSGQKSSMVLLCTPTQNSSNTSTMPFDENSHMPMKKIPLKNDNANSSQELNGLNPYILIVSDNKETEIPLKNSVTKNKHAILRIQIEKRINNVSSNNSTINSPEGQCKPNHSNATDEQNFTKSSCLEEIEVDDVSSSKIVVFKFDPSTGEITVRKRERFNQNTECEKKSNANNLNTINNHDSSKDVSKETYIEVQNNSKDSLKNQKAIMREEETVHKGNSPTEKCELKTTTKEEESSVKNPQIIIAKVDSQIPTTDLTKNEKVPVSERKTRNSSNQHLKPDLHATTNNVQKRKSDVITIVNISEDETEKLSKNIKKVKKGAKATKTKLQ